VFIDTARGAYKKYEVKPTQPKTNFSSSLGINEKGAGWPLFCLRTRQGPVRTKSLLPVQIKIPLNETIPVYQKLASKIKELKALGMSHDEIATRLKINRKTVGKALNLA
jgi:hypothetical protein